MLELADCADEVDGNSCPLSLFGAVLDYKQYFLRFFLLDKQEIWLNPVKWSFTSYKDLENTSLSKMRNHFSPAHQYWGPRGSSMAEFGIYSGHSTGQTVSTEIFVFQKKKLFDFDKTLFEVFAVWKELISCGRILTDLWINVFIVDSRVASTVASSG